MSEPSDSASDDQRSSGINGSATDNNNQDDVCRDFLRNSCRRGKRCKYRHPPGEGQENNNSNNNNATARESSMGPGGKPEPTFCHDYQNMGCHRPSCKFLHCTREEEELYHQTGQLPPRVQPQAEVPLCRDYLKGDCNRGSKCKYRHMGAHQSDYDLDLPPPPRHQDSRHGFPPFEDGYHRFDRYEYMEGPPAPKRRRGELDNFGVSGGGGGYDNGRYDSGGRVGVSGGGGGGGVRPGGIGGSNYQMSVLEEENAALRRRVEELKKQVSDLTATNEVLLEQNARLRVSHAPPPPAPPAPIVAATSLPMAYSHTSQPPAFSVAPMATAAALGGGIVGGMGAGGLMSTSMTHQIALNSDMATQHALQQQRMAAHQAAQQAQVQAARPPQQQLSGLKPPAVSMHSALQSLTAQTNPLLAVSLPSLVTPAGPPLQQQVPPGGCPPSNPLVSYPIMSQDMRCAVVPSSLGH